MKRAFLHGLVFGAGFMISAVLMGAISMFALPWDGWFSTQTAQIMEESKKALSSADGVRVVAHEKILRGDEVVVLGTLKNDAKSTARGFSIEVELFDKDRKFVDVCRESFFGSTIAPGEARNFKVSCNGCRNRPIPEHASYTVHLTSGL